MPQAKSIYMEKCVPACVEITVHYPLKMKLVSCWSHWNLPIMGKGWDEDLRMEKLTGDGERAVDAVL